MSRRLAALRVGNFKAFADTQRIPLKPITLIFGPNSAGKSSVIHSLALAHEAVRSGKLDLFRTEVGGTSIDLGGFRQYVHKTDRSRRVEWGAEIDASQLSGPLAERLNHVGQVSVSLLYGLVGEAGLDRLPAELGGRKPSTVYGGKLVEGTDSRVVVMSYELEADGELLVKMSRRRDGSMRLDQLNREHPVFQQLLEAIVLANSFTDRVSEADLQTLRDVIDLLVPEIQAKVESFLPEVLLLDTRANQPIGPGGRQDQLAGAVGLFFPRAVADLVNGVNELVRAEIGTLAYLGPLRSFPPRHLAFAEYEDRNWYAGGGYAWDVARRDDQVREAVNGWLGSDKLKTPYHLEVRSLVDTQAMRGPLRNALQGRPEPLGYKTMASLLLELADDFEEAAALAKAKTSVERARLSAFIEEWQKVAAAQKGRDRDLVIAEALGAWNAHMFEDATEEQNPAIEADEQADRLVQAVEFSDLNKIHNLMLVDLRTDTHVTHRDVGIGISQVLPVLVAAYGSRNKLLAMEQPEIHLHPALQAELADVFIETALGERQNTFILETHSEHLVLRLLRRVREGRIRPDDISILFVEPLPDRGSRIVELHIDEDGDFIDQWPGGFFEESFHEKFSGR